MKSWITLLLGLLLIFNLAACRTNERPAAASAGVVAPDQTATPSQLPPSASPTNLPEPTAPASPTAAYTPTALPLPTLTSTPLTCQSGQIESHELETALLEAPLAYRVYLPPCYAHYPAHHYPVIYLFHGQTYDNQHWFDLGAAEHADHLILSGEVPPFMMVFPYDTRHYDPPTINPFGEAVLLNLIPAIDQAYRTIPTRTARAIGGISRGGNWAAHLSLQHPSLFGVVGLHSTPVFSTDTNKDITTWLAAIPVDQFPRLFLDIGENDRWLDYTLVFEALLDNASVPHEWHLYPGFHEDAYWEAHLEEYLRWYATEMQSGS